MGTRKSGQVLLPLPLGQLRPPGIHRARCASPGPGKRGSLGPYPTSAPSTAAHRPLHAPLRSHHLLPAYPLLRRPPRFDHLLVRACSSPLPRRSAALDLDPLLGRLAARLRHPDLQHPVPVRRRDNVRSGPFGQLDLAYEASVPEFAAITLRDMVLVGELFDLDRCTSHRLVASGEPAEILERPARQPVA